MSNMIVKDQLRSTSLPSRSHPSTTCIEEALNKFKTINTTPDSSKSILIGLTGLEKLYDCTKDFLKMSSTQRILSSDGSELKEEMLDGSLRLMDICSVSRDLMVETHEHVRSVQSCVRRKRVTVVGGGGGGGGDQDVAISDYLGFRKKMRKEAKKLLVSLKKIDGSSCSSSCVDEQLVAVIDTMRLVVSITVSILKSFLEFLLGRKSNMKSKLASVLKKKKDHHHHKETTKNEFENLDYVICYSCDDLQKKLDDVEMSIDGFEKNLEGLFRRLIRTRASLLNIISTY